MSKAHINSTKTTKTKKDQEPLIQLMEIGPAQASAWLEQSKFDNRSLDQRRVNKLAAEIKKGRWVFDGTPIRLDCDGNVLDGQHRLWAIHKSGQAVQSLVISNLQSEAKDVIDTGKARTLHDILHFHGYVNNALLAGAVRYAIGWEGTGGDLREWAKTWAKGKLATQEVLAKLDAEKGFERATAAALPLNWCRKFLGGPNTVFAYYLLRKTTGPLKLEYLVDNFFQQLESGENLQVGDPILVLRNTLSVIDRSYHHARSGGTRLGVYRIALVIKAWNAWRENRQIKLLRFGDDEQYPIPS